METTFHLKLKQSPQNSDCSQLTWEDSPISVLLLAPDKADYCTVFGRLVLISLDLECTLRTALHYMREAYNQTKTPNNIDPELANVSFSGLIQIFKQQVDMSYPGTRKIIKQLHKVRIFRNELAHKTLDSDRLINLMSFGGREKLISELSARINELISLIALLYRVGRNFSAMIGMTSEYLEMKSAKMMAEYGVSTSDEYMAFFTGNKGGDFLKKIDLDSL